MQPLAGDAVSGGFLRLFDVPFRSLHGPPAALPPPLPTTALFVGAGAGAELNFKASEISGIVRTAAASARQAPIAEAASRPGTRESMACRRGSGSAASLFVPAHVMASALARLKPACHARPSHPISLCFSKSTLRGARIVATVRGERGVG